MSSIISFSADEKFLGELDSLIYKSGYKNRSRFLRDAAIYFSEIKQRGELMEIADEIIIEGHVVIHYDPKDDQKLMVSRTGSVEVAAYHHSSRLGHSCHLSVDVIHVKGRACDVREIIKNLQNTSNVDKVSFILAPMKDESCC